MADKNTIQITITADGAKADKSLRTVTRSLDNLGDSARKQSDATALLGRSIGVVAGASALAGAAVTALGGYMLTRGVAAANVQEAAEADLGATLKATGHAAGYTLDQLKEMASGMQQVTTVGDEVTLAGMAILSTFKQVRGEAFERATAAALDMSQVMKQDLRSSMVQLGKALNDPTEGLTALSRVGVSFTEQQKRMIKQLQESGDTLGAQKIILDELESEFGGAARAAAGTFGGSVKQAQNSVGDLTEEIGFFLTKNDALIGMVRDFRDWVDASIPKVREIGDQFRAWTAANEGLIRQRIDEYVDRARKALGAVWDLITYDPAILEWGLIGLAIGGKKGALLLGTAAHAAEWAENFGKAMGLASAGVINFSDVATANFTELKNLVNSFDTDDVMLIQQKIDRKMAELSSVIPYGTPGNARAQYADRIQQLKDEIDSLNAAKAGLLALKTPSAAGAEGGVESPAGNAPDPAGTPAAPKATDKYAEVLRRLQDEYDWLRKTEVEQKALAAARVAGVSEGSERYAVLLGLMQKIHGETEAMARETAITEFNENIDRQAQLIGKSEAEQAALNLAWEHGLEVGGAAYQTALDALNRLTAAQRIYNAELESARAAEKRKTSVRDSVADIESSLKSEEERIRESYLRRENIVLEAMIHDQANHEKYTRIITGLHEKMGEELGALADKTFNEQLGEAVTGWAAGFSGTLNDILWQSDTTFEDIGRSFAKMITEMIIQLTVIQPMIAALNAAMKTSSSGGSLWSSLSSFGSTLFGIGAGADPALAAADVGFNPQFGLNIPGLARGGVLDAGRVIPFATGGIVNAPTIFPMARGLGLMGEAGPEAVLPLARTGTGDLGVKVASGDSGAALGEAKGGLRIINVMDPSVVGDYLGTASGERLVVNIMQKNRKALS